MERLWIAAAHYPPTWSASWTSRRMPSWFPFQDAHYERLTQTGIPLLLLADYMESSPLGRAEWMRFYGRLTGKAREADSLFLRVDSIYQGLRAQARRLPKGRSLLTERKTGSVWYCPGGQSTIGQLLADAHAGYPLPMIRTQAHCPSRPSKSWNRPTA